MKGKRVKMTITLSRISGSEGIDYNFGAYKAPWATLDDLELAKQSHNFCYSRDLFGKHSSWIKRLRKVLKQPDREIHDYAWVCKAFDTQSGSELPCNVYTKESLATFWMDLDLECLAAKRPFLLLVKNPQKPKPSVLLLKRCSQKNQVSTYAYFCPSNQTFYPCCEKVIRDLENQMGSNDLVIVFNKNEPSKRQVLYGRATKDPLGTLQRFYQEIQFGEGCAIHAINAFIGLRAVNEITYEQCLRKVLLKQGVMKPVSKWGPEEFDPRNTQRINADVLSVGKGVDMSVMCRLLKKLAKENKIAKNFKKAKVYSFIVEVQGGISRIVEKTSRVTLNTFLKTRDRFVVMRSNPDHAVAYRKFSDNVTWARIDSLVKEQELITQVEWDLFDNGYPKEVDKAEVQIFALDT